MKPSVGRIVHYVNELRSEHVAAVVTSVEKDTVIWVTAFYPGRVPTPIPHPVRQSEKGQEEGTWHWPERET